MLLLRGATKLLVRVLFKHLFQYMLLLRGATLKLYFKIAVFRFQYMLLLRGATFPTHRAYQIANGFNTCSSCEEQHTFPDFPIFQLSVSIHAPLARSNIRSSIPIERSMVSIHAPLARSNFKGLFVNLQRSRFNTCSSCEEQLNARRKAKGERKCFNTCSSCEEQLRKLRKQTGFPRFNTCSSCEEQQSC